MYKTTRLILGGRAVSRFATWASLFSVIFVAALGCISANGQAFAADRPNILWISCEDISPHLHGYGYEHAITPTLDKLAERGVRYTHTFTTTPVCATNRSSIITGMYPTTIGTQYMRCHARLPEHIRCFTEYLREAGYYCTNNSKTDYNFSHPKTAWDASSGKAHWRGRKPDQPFFHVRNFTNTHESRNWSRAGGHQNQTKELKPDQRQDPAALPLPPYYPDTPEVRRDWANYYENITQLDYHVARLLKQLDDDGLADNTIVVYWSDHGVGLPRGKRWLYDSGTRVPMIVTIPEKLRTGDQGRPGTVTDELVSFIDLAPTVLNLAGVDIPKHMQGRAFLGPNLSPPRQYVFSVRDRMDERYDIIRSVRDKRYRYTRNYMPFKPYAQYLNYAERNQTMKALRRLAATNDLPAAAQMFMADRKPVEELYDTEADPHEVHNLVGSRTAENREVLERMRAAHRQWMTETDDLGFIPEPIVHDLEAALGSRYAILQQPEIRKQIPKVRDLVAAVTAGNVSPNQLAQALADKDPVMRYWAAIGYTNLAAGFLVAADSGLTKSTERQKPSTVHDALASAAKDTNALVRVAAAEGLCHAGGLEQGLPILIAELRNSNPWTNLYAAIALDDLDEKARPATAALEKALKSAKNKYVARVAERALQALKGRQPQDI